jgi:ribosomal protein S18 acetylase RimI-like enzyme
MTRNRDEIKIRRITRNDLPQVNDVDCALVGDSRVPSWPFTFETYWNIYGPGVSFLAEINGKVVGFLAGNIVAEERSNSIVEMVRTTHRTFRYPKVGWIDMIGVLPEFQSKHIGQSLVNAFYEECKANGAPMRGIVRNDDERLIGFLERVGFKKSETTIMERD